MACSSSTCNSSGCYKEYEEEQHKPKTRAAVNGGNSHQNLCVKCKSNEPVCCGIGGDDAKFCKDCFKTNLYGKFKQAVSYNAMITPSDKVLVSFSGGPSSRFLSFSFPLCFFFNAKNLEYFAKNVYICLL